MTTVFPLLSHNFEQNKIEDSDVVFQENDVSKLLLTVPHFKP